MTPPESTPGVSDKAVEALAAYIYGIDGRRPWDALLERTREDYRSAARQALSQIIDSLHEVWAEGLERLAAELDAGGEAERDADEPGVPSSVYHHAAELLRQHLAAHTQPDSPDQEGGDARAQRSPEAIGGSSDLHVVEGASEGSGAPSSSPDSPEEREAPEFKEPDEDLYREVSGPEGREACERCGDSRIECFQAGGTKVPCAECVGVRSAVEAEIDLLRDSATAAQGLAASRVADDLESGPGLEVAATANRRTTDRLQRILATSQPSEDRERPENVWIECQGGYLRVMPPGDWIDFEGTAHYVPVARAEKAEAKLAETLAAVEQHRSGMASRLSPDYDELRELNDALYAALDSTQPTPEKEAGDER